MAVGTDNSGRNVMQIVIDRHHFVLSVGAAMSPNDKFDLLIKGGDVLDPSQRSGNTPGMPFLM